MNHWVVNALGGVAFSLLSVTATHAQSEKFQHERLSVSAGLGVAGYGGDLSSSMTPGQIMLGPSASVGAYYQLLPHLAARTEARFYQIRGDQAKTANYQNNLSFRSRNPDFYLGLEVSLFPPAAKPNWNVGLYLGAGFTYLITKAQYAESWLTLPPYQTEGVAYSRTPVVLPAGLVISHQLNKRYLLQLDISMGYLLSDYLDDVSTVYPNPDALSSDVARALSDRRPELGLPPNQAGNQRGNPSNKDTYIIAQIKLKRTFTLVRSFYRRSLRCPN
ncbi:outer membrane beta-barrel protein [Tellurirhabdus bombi]|uniref:outer membrane beta-barrel protein n=1 Tax=Tellurirhabdus bombi TaxID=2907205 RepID=UPI001F1B06DC|nr:outer membrane beta-barrel protein [Tellurirhabdus bombi]